MRETPKTSKIVKYLINKIGISEKHALGIYEQIKFTGIAEVIIDKRPLLNKSVNRNFKINNHIIKASGKLNNSGYFDLIFKKLNKKSKTKVN